VAGALAAAALALGGLALLRANLPPAITPPPGLSAAAAQACARWHAALPQSLDGQEKRSTRPRSELTAAYGSPAMSLRCGVTVPGPDPDHQCISDSENHVDWLVVPRDTSTLLVSFGRDPAVELVVPDAYPRAPVDSLSAAVDLLPSNGLHCS
jgi:Protein of unknown function (DUF3515)